VLPFSVTVTEERIKTPEGVEFQERAPPLGLGGGRLPGWRFRGKFLGSGELFTSVDLAGILGGRPKQGKPSVPIPFARRHDGRRNHTRDVQFERTEQ
jgi:hypothetical protein